MLRWWRALRGNPARLATPNAAADGDGQGGCAARRPRDMGLILSRVSAVVDQALAHEKTRHLAFCVGHSRVLVGSSRDLSSTWSRDRRRRCIPTLCSVGHHFGGGGGGLCHGGSGGKSGRNEGQCGPSETIAPTAGAIGATETTEVSCLAHAQLWQPSGNPKLRGSQYSDDSGGVDIPWAALDSPLPPRMLAAC